MRNKDVRRNNLLILIEKFGKKSKLALASGTSADYISQIANKHRDMGDAFAESLETGLNLPTGWMDDIHEEYEISNLEIVTRYSAQEISGASPPSSVLLTSHYGNVPLIPWPGQDSEHINTGKTNILAMIPCPAPHGSDTFCLKVESDAMTAPYGKSYPPKCVIFIDPEISESVTPGDRVLARISNGEYVFKELSVDGGRRFLRSLNQQYPPIHDKFRIIGKVIGKWENE